MDAFVIENILHEHGGYKRLVLAGDEPDKVVDYHNFKRCGFVVGGLYCVDAHGICQHQSKPEPKSAPVPASSASKKPSSTPKATKGSKKTSPATKKRNK